MGQLSLLCPVSCQVSSQPDTHRVLVSGFPDGLKLSEEELLDKLEIFFGKVRNGGGDVETREMLQGTVMLGFVDEKGKGPVQAVRGSEIHSVSYETERRDALMSKAILPFLTVAQHLCQTGQFTVPLGQQRVPLRVSPYVRGEIQKAEVSAGWGRGRKAQGPQTLLAYTAAFLGFQTHPMFSWDTPCSDLCFPAALYPMNPCHFLSLFSRSDSTRHLTQCW